MKSAVLHLLLVAVFAVSTAVADGQISLSPQVIDLGEIVAGGCCTREFTISNVTENVVAIERIESEAEVSVLIFKDALAAHDHQTVCVCLKAGQVAGDFAADVSIFARGSSGSVVRLRLLGKVVESDDGFIYSDAGFGTVSYGMSVTGTNCVVWRCRERMQKCLATEHETNLISRVVALDTLRGPWSKDPIFAFCTEEMSRLLRPLLLEGKCSDAEKEELIEKCGFKTHFIHNTELDKEVREYLHNKEVALAKARIAQHNEERERKMQEWKKAREEAERARQEQFAKWREESRKREAELVWHRVELPGLRTAKVWEEYLAGDGKPFADNVHFKTNVFLPFLVREFGVEKVGDESLRKKILELLETEFVDPLCHLGEAAERAKSSRRATSLSAGCWGESVNWAYEQWTAGEKHNPFVLALAPFYGGGKERKIKLHRLKGKDGSTLWGGVYELSEEFVPSGREGLPVHFVRNICRCRNRGRYSEDYPDKRYESLVAWCSALEREGARPEHWRCVLLLSLRVAGSLTIPRPNIGMADALEKAGVAPFLAKMLREEPVYERESH